MISFPAILTSQTPLAESLSGKIGGSRAIIETTASPRTPDGEFDADYFAVQYVYKTGYDPKCFVSFVQRIWGSGSAANAKISRTFSSYPPLEERLHALQNEISEILPLRDGATVSTSEFDAFLERLRAQKSEGQKRPTLRTPSHAIPNLP